MRQKYGRNFELQSSEPWGNKNNLNAQFEFQLIGVETKSVPYFSFLRSLHYKYCFEFCWVHLDRDTVGSTKCLCTRVLLQIAVRMTKGFQKTRTPRIESVPLWWQGPLRMDSFNLGETWLLHKKGGKVGTGRSESHPSLSLLGFPHCQRCFQEVIPKSSLWCFPPCEC